MTESVVRWSHSSLKDYEGCARRYHQVKVLKRYPFVENDATRYGTQVHEAIEFYIKEQRPLPDSYLRFKPIVDALLAKQGRPFPEYEMALDEALNVCNWDSPKAWVRGIADILIIDDETNTAWVGDWKTGNNRYPDKDQLVLMSLLVFQHFPHVRKVNAALLFIVHETMVKLQMLREQAPAAWQRYRERVAKVAASHEHDVWNPKSSPLCRWCPVKHCEFHPE